MQGLPIEYCKHVIEKTKAIVNKPSIFMFKRLKMAIKLKIIAVKNAK